MHCPRSWFFWRKFSPFTNTRTAQMMRSHCAWLANAVFVPNANGAIAFDINAILDAKGEGFLDVVAERQTFHQRLRRPPQWSPLAGVAMRLTCRKAHRRGGPRLRRVGTGAYPAQIIGLPRAVREVGTMHEEDATRIGPLRR